MTREQIEWLKTYDRNTGKLSTWAARCCGYGDAVRAGLVLNVGPETMPDLRITGAGIAYLTTSQSP